MGNTFIFCSPFCSGDEVKHPRPVKMQKEEKDISMLPTNPNTPETKLVPLAQKSHKSSRAQPNRERPLTFASILFTEQEIKATLPTAEPSFLLLESPPKEVYLCEL